MPHPDAGLATIRGSSSAVARGLHSVGHQNSSGPLYPEEVLLETSSGSTGRQGCDSLLGRKKISLVLLPLVQSISLGEQLV